VPWVAVLVFDPEELKLLPEEIAGLPIQQTLTEGAPAMPVSLGAEQKTTPTSGAYPMNVAQFLTYFAPPDRANYEKMKAFPASAKEFARLLKSQESTSIIFPKRKLITDIFGATGGNLEQHKHLAHVRRVNTMGMPDAGTNEVGTFSVIVSHRTGKLLFEIVIHTGPLHWVIARDQWVFIGARSSKSYLIGLLRGSLLILVRAS
jgi:hypothetical protein